MRLQDVEISETGILEVDIMELPINCLIVISNGKVKIGALPAFAETRIKTHNGEVKRINFDEGETF